MPTLSTLDASSKRTPATNHGEAMPSAASNNLSCKLIAPARHGRRVSMPHRPRRSADRLASRAKDPLRRAVPALDSGRQPTAPPNLPARNSREAVFKVSDGASSGQTAVERRGPDRARHVARIPATSATRVKDESRKATAKRSKVVGGNAAESEWEDF